MPKQTTAKALREQLGGLGKEIQGMADAIREEDRTFTEEEQGKWDKLHEDFDRIKGRAEAIERGDAIGAYLASPARPDGPPATIAAEQTAENERAAAELAKPRIVHHHRVRSFEGPTAQEDAYKCGMWLWGMAGDKVRGSAEARDWCRRQGVMSTTSNPVGGFVTPPAEFARAVINLQEQYGVFRSQCRVMPTEGDTFQQPRRTAGPTVYFAGDNTEITASDSAWDLIEVDCRKWAILCKYSSELSEDAVISMADWLADEMARQFALKEDQCGFLGDGTSTYGHIQGLITKCAAATATVVTAAAANLKFADLDLADFESMLGKLPEYSGINAAWYIHKAGWAASMMRLADAAGGNTRDIIEGRASQSFLGYPVIFSQVMNSTLTDQASTNGLCYFGDLRMAATMAERRGMRVDVSTDRYFEYDQIGIKATQRTGITVHDVGDTSNAGAMIMLATPAA